MSAFMIHSFAFTKWFLRKQLDFQIINQNDFNFAVAQLDQSIWDEFESTDDYASIVKPAVETIIPLLVQNMPAKTRKYKGKPNNSIDIANNDSNSATDVAAKSKKTRGPNKKKTVVSEEQTDSILTEAHTITQENGGKPIKKTRGPNKKKPITEDAQETVANELDVKDLVVKDLVVKDLGEDGGKPIKKPRGPNKKKPITEDVEGTVANELVTKELVTKELVTKDLGEDGGKPIKKPRGPNKKKPITEDVEGTVANELVAKDLVTKDLVEDGGKPIKKPRGPNKKKSVLTEQQDIAIIANNSSEDDSSEKLEIRSKPIKKPRPNKSKNSEIHTNVPDDEIVLPIEEFGQFALNNQQVQNDMELQEESFDLQQQDEEIELTEMFMNEHLYYVDANDNWFDSHLQSVLKPAF